MIVAASTLPSQRRTFSGTRELGARVGAACGRVLAVAPIALEKVDCAQDCARRNPILQGPRAVEQQPLYGVPRGVLSAFFDLLAACGLRVSWVSTLPLIAVFGGFFFLSSYLMATRYSRVWCASGYDFSSIRTTSAILWRSGYGPRRSSITLTFSCG
jgi:hypothetical protein